jgi:hypothetical protein
LKYLIEWKKVFKIIWSFYGFLRDIEIFMFAKKSLLEAILFTGYGWTLVEK